MIKNILIAVAVIAGISGFTTSVCLRNNKFVFIEMGKVYEDFALSKELNAGLQKTLLARKAITDSLFETLQQQTRELRDREQRTAADMQTLSALEEEYHYKKDLFEKDNQKAAEECSNKIWSRLNQYIHDYGENKRLNIIFGANGQGNIMYGENSSNISEEVTEYVNARYNDQLKK